MALLVTRAQGLSLAKRKAMIDKTSELAIAKQCQLLNLAKSSYYYQPVAISDETLGLMKAIDQLHLDKPYLGSRQLRNRLRDQGL